MLDDFVDCTYAKSQTEGNTKKVKLSKDIKNYFY